MIKISVAMTCYNGEKYITEQLNSIMNQIRKPDEVIIVDDMSTDLTVQTVKDFIEKNSLVNWRIVENEENLGFIKNFKKAISLTTGDIIFLCDQDDIWCEDKIEGLSNIFASNKNVMAVSSSFSLIDGNGENINTEAEKGKSNFGLIGYTLKRNFEKIPLTTIMHSNISPGCTCALSRKLADIYIKSTESILPHDYEINIMAASMDGLYFYNVPFVKYRIHNNNTLGFNKKQQTRIEIANEKLNAAQSVMCCTGDSSIYDICALRLDLLKKGTFLKIIKLNFSKIYRRFYSFHERAGDILYVLRRK